MNDIKMRDEYIQELHTKLKDADEMLQFKQDDINSLQDSLQALDLRYAELNIEKDKYAYQLKLLEKNLNAIDAVTMSMGGHDSPNVSVKSGLSMLFNPELNDHEAQKLIKLTSAARGFLARKRVNKIKITKLADETGVLIAKDKTIQGESGWYVGPGQNLFYFVLKEGKWIYTTGPLTDQEYKLPQLSIGNISKKLPSAQVLSRCTFKIGGLSEFDGLNQGEVYMANGSGKLYLAMSVDDLMCEIDANPNAFVNNEGSLIESLLSSKLDDMSSLDSATNNNNLLLANTSITSNSIEED